MMKERLRRITITAGAILYSASLMLPGMQVMAAPATDIGVEGAKQAVCTYSGLTQDQVIFTKIDTDYDDGRKTYEVEFLVGNYLFEYEIDSSSAAVIKTEFELANVVPTPAAQTPVQPPAPVVPTPAPAQEQKTTASIDRNKAVDIAMKHAGVSANSVRELEVDYDYDDGVAEYEVEFKVNRMEYSYDINAANGAILSYEIEEDD